MVPEEIAQPEVLWVEDDRVDFELLSSHAQSHGMRITHAWGVADAARKLAEHEGLFHATVLDSKLPNGEGIDLLRQLMAQDPDTAIVVLSGHSDDEQLANFLRHGAYSAHYKGDVAPRAITVIIRNAVRSSERKRQRRAIVSDLLRVVEQYEAHIR